MPVLIKNKNVSSNIVPKREIIAPVAAAVSNQPGLKSKRTSFSGNKKQETNKPGGKKMDGT